MTLNLPPFLTGFVTLRNGWLRIFGVGLRWKDTRVVPTLFSERTGKVRSVRVGAWAVRWLPRA